MQKIYRLQCWSHNINQLFSYTYFFPVYSEDNTLIPKNTSLIIARVPLAQTGKKNFVNNAEAPERTMAAPRGAMVEAGEVDLSKMTGSEEDKINAMMAQSTIDYDPTK